MCSCCTCGCWCDALQRVGDRHHWSGGAVLQSGSNHAQRYVGINARAGGIMNQ
jgi:hypothetical protein